MYLPRVKDQGRTKDEPRMNQRTPNHQKVHFIKIVISFMFLIPYLIPPSDDREKTEGTPHQLRTSKKCIFLRIILPSV